MTCDLWRNKLDAYVDESLSPEELSAVEDHLRACHSCTADALARLQLKRATRAAAARYTPSPEFRLRISQSLHKSRKPLRVFSWLPKLAAAALVLVFVSISATMWMQHETRAQVMAELLDLHVATLASANPVDVISTDRHTVKPWFQGKLPFTFNLPELANSSFTLLGGKLIYFNHSPDAQLLFALRKHQLSVFILQDQPAGSLPQAGFTTSSLKGFSVETWGRAGLRYVVIGDTSPADIHALADLLRAAAGS
ncbi:MAG: zf-HC2 domain-containing protein [Terracidiphilus sp.]|jgi:anti-sigma factor RsiW